MRHFRNPQSGDVHGYDDDQDDLVQLAIEAKWEELPVWPFPPTQKELDDTKAAEVRAVRQQLLQEADHAINIAEDNGNDSTQLRQYRQALRDVTKQVGFPHEVEWPVNPEKEK